jgi:hypothetical protein
MTLYLFDNNAEGTLSAAIGASDLAFVLGSGEGALFPSPAAGEGFFVYVEEGSSYEWMLCTSRSSDTFTVTRAQEGSSGTAFTNAATVKLLLNSTALESFMQKGAERTVSADPNGTAAVYTGEEVLDSTSGIWWKHTASTTWQALNSV